MKYKCYWEHNGDNIHLFTIGYLGANTREKLPEIVKDKIPNEIQHFTLRSEQARDMEMFNIETSEERSYNLSICDVNTDAISNCETYPMTLDKHKFLKSLALKSMSTKDSVSSIHLARQNIHKSNVTNGAKNLWRQNHPTYLLF